MRILWITNVFPPEINKKLNISIPASGGWLESMSLNLLRTDPSIEIVYASPIPNNKKIIKGHSEHFKYYALPSSFINGKISNQIESWRNINKETKPDIVHIHGTEYGHGLAYIMSCGSKNVVVSIQGLISIIARYADGHITIRDIIKNLTLNEFINRRLLDTEYIMRHRTKQETLYIKTVNHVIGRTDWDKVHVKTINPHVQYHNCNESLRNGFYNEEWDIKKCKKHSIFISQSQQPLKGLHQILKAMPLVLRHFPDAHLYIAGQDFLYKKKNIKEKIFRNSFSKYLLKIIRNNNLEKNITFTGTLSEKEMIRKYLESNVFVCCSSIENSSNSIGEAQLLGVPVIASYVGGTPSMIEDNKTGFLYRFEEYEMLAYNICRIFNNEIDLYSLHKREREIASFRHNIDINAKKMISIYEYIYKNKQ